MRITSPPLRLLMVIALVGVCAAPVARAQSAVDVQLLKMEIQALKERQEAMQKEIDALKASAAAPKVVPTGDGVLRIDKAQVRGNASAKVVLVDVSDFQCPFCGRHFRQTAPTIEKEYVATGKIRHAFVNFPLMSHRNAFKAAEAGACAGDQGKFWELHDQMFSNQARLELALLPTQAAAVPSLNQDQFRACLESGRHAEDIRRDMSMASAAGVTATPTFFIGTIDPKTQTLKVTSHIVGAKSYAVFQQALDAAIGATR